MKVVARSKRTSTGWSSQCWALMTTMKRWLNALWSTRRS